MVRGGSTKKAKDVQIDLNKTEGSDEPEAESSKPKATLEDSSSLSDVDDEIGQPDVPQEAKGVSSVAVDGMSESELSELIDEGPKPKRRKKGTSNGKKTTQKTEPKKRGRKAAEKKDLDPDVEEIKRLQGWLVKCGIRKMWARELKPYESPKEKIKYLKEMLSDAGMSGRYSAEKAAQIRDARELAADLEAIQQGDKRWGKLDSGEDEEEEEEQPRSKRPTHSLLDDIDFASD